MIMYSGKTHVAEKDNVLFFFLFSFLAAVDLYNLQHQDPIFLLLCTTHFSN